MLTRRQQKTSPILQNDVPVIQALAIVVDKLETSVIQAIGTVLQKPGKRINDLARVIDRPLIGKALPFESAATQFDPVTFVRDAGWLVEAFVTGTGSQ